MLSCPSVLIIKLIIKLLITPTSITDFLIQVFLSGCKSVDVLINIVIVPKKPAHRSDSTIYTAGTRYSPQEVLSEQTVCTRTVITGNTDRVTANTHVTHAAISQICRTHRKHRHRHTLVVSTSALKRARERRCTNWSVTSQTHIVSFRVSLNVRIPGEIFLKTEKISCR